MTDTSLLASTGHFILAMATATSKSLAELGSDGEREAHLNDLFAQNDIVYVAFWLSAREFSFLCAKGDQALSTGDYRRTTAAVCVDSFDAAVRLGLRYGDADARGYLPMLTLSRIPPTSRFRTDVEARLSAADERRQRRDAKRATGGGPWLSAPAVAVWPRGLSR